LENACRPSALQAFSKEEAEDAHSLISTSLLTRTTSPGGFLRGLCTDILMHRASDGIKDTGIALAKSFENQRTNAREYESLHNPSLPPPPSPTGFSSSNKKKTHLVMHGRRCHGHRKDEGPSTRYQAYQPIPSTIRSNRLGPPVVRHFSPSLLPALEKPPLIPRPTHRDPRIGGASDHQRVEKDRCRWRSGHV